MKVKVYPYSEYGMGNIIWPGKFPMRGGKFPSDHPIRPPSLIASFRARGYWASCFPEGDGICWKPERGQSNGQCIKDIRECFGWDAQWGRATDESEVPKMAEQDEGGEKK